MTDIILEERLAFCVSGAVAKKATEFLVVYLKNNFSMRLINFERNVFSVSENVYKQPLSPRRMFMFDMLEYLNI